MYIPLFFRLCFLPEKIRHCIVCVAFLCVSILIFYGMYVRQTEGLISLGIFPLSLAAWLVSWKAVLRWYGAMLLFFLLCNQILIHARLWSIDILLPFACGMLTFLFLAAGIHLVKSYLAVLCDLTLPITQNLMTDIERFDELLYQATTQATGLPTYLPSLARNSLQEHFSRLYVELHQRGIAIQIEEEA